MPDIREHSNELLRLILAGLPMEGEATLAWDEDNQCSLTFDEDLAVVLTLDEVVDAIFMSWVLGELPPEPEQGINAMQELLEANHEWNMTEGGTFGIDPATSVVSLSYRVDLPLDEPAVIQDIIAKLYNICTHWQKELELGYYSETTAHRSVRDLL